MVAKMLMGRDIAGFVNYGLYPTSLKYSGIITANSEQTLTVPESPFSDCPKMAALFCFSPGSMIWVAYNETAEIPSGSIAATTSEANPQLRYLNPGDVIHLITSDASDEYGITFYAST